MDNIILNLPINNTFLKDFLTNYKILSKSLLLTLGCVHATCGERRYDELLFRNRDVLRLFGFQGSRAYLSVKQTAKVLQWRDEMAALPDDHKIFSCIELLFKEPASKHLNGIRLRLSCGASANLQTPDKCFTKIPLQVMNCLSSKYSKLLYLLLLQFKATKWRRLKFNDLLERFGIKKVNTGSFINRFKYDVLQPAIDELQELGLIKGLTYEIKHDALFERGDLIEFHYTGYGTATADPGGFKGFYETDPVCVSDDPERYPHDQALYDDEVDAFMYPETKLTKALNEVQKENDNQEFTKAVPKASPAASEDESVKAKVPKKLLKIPYNLPTAFDAKAAFSYALQRIKYQNCIFLELERYKLLDFHAQPGIYKKRRRLQLSKFLTSLVKTVADILDKKEEKERFQA